MDSWVVEFAAPKGRPSVAQGETLRDGMSGSVFFSPEGATVTPNLKEIEACVGHPSGTREPFPGLRAKPRVAHGVSSVEPAIPRRVGSAHHT